MSEQRYYPGWGRRIDELAGHLERSWLGNGFEVQALAVLGEAAEAGGTILQVRETYSEGWQKTLSSLTGLDTAATVALKREGENLAVEVGGGKWMDKAAVAGVGLLTAGILLLPAGIGAVKQQQLLNDLLAEIDRYVRTASGAASAPPSA